MRNLLSWRHSGFSVHGAVRVEDRQGAVRLGRYMIRCPLALKRLSWNEDTAEVAYTARPTRRSGPLPSTTNWDVLEFIARVVDYLPEPSQQMTRYWGFYANAARGKRRKVEEEEPTGKRVGIRFSWPRAEVAGYGGAAESPGPTLSCSAGVLHLPWEVGS